MSSRTKHRGGAPVGYINELDPIESSAVCYLRLWCEGFEAQRAIVRDLETAFGEETGRRVAGNFEELCKLCIHHGRRPLMRHGVQGKCLGADESCLANFIAYAADGARDDAMIIAMTIVSPDKAPFLACLAENFGMALREMAVTTRVMAPQTINQTLH